MRFFLTAILTLSLHLTFVAPAEARGIPISYGTEDALDLVEVTKIKGPSNAPMTLCHYTSKYHVAQLGFWRTSHGYALTDDNCAGSAYYDISASDFAEAQKDGLISADLPAVPKMSLKLIASGFAGFGIAALVVLILLTNMIVVARRKAARKAQMGDIPKAAAQILDAMCHAAISDGSVDDSEIVQIAEIAKQMTGEVFGASRIQTIISKASKTPSDSEFKAFGAGLAPDQKELLVKAVYTVVAADGQITKAEQEFFFKTAQALKIGDDTLNRIVNEAQGES